MGSETGSMRASMRGMHRGTMGDRATESPESMATMSTSHMPTPSLLPTFTQLP